MPRTCLAAARVFAATFFLCVFLASPLLAQRADRATISGVVTDEQGAPRAGCDRHDQATRTPPSRRPSSPTTRASTARRRWCWDATRVRRSRRLQEAVTTGIAAPGRRSGAPRRDDAGRRRHRNVEVTSADEGLADTRPDVSHTVNEKYYRDLPIVTAADVRLAEAVLQIQPGYLPMKPNGDPMFRGSQFNSRINGGQTRRPRTSSTARRSATRSAISRATRARRRSKRSRR